MDTTSTNQDHGTVAMVHGFTGESSWFVQLLFTLQNLGFITCAIDHQGHGFSDGLQCHIPDINPVVDDCINYFDLFRAQHSQSLPYHGLGLFLGAMCGISPKFKPPWPLEHFLSVVAWVVPTWQVVPTRGSIPLVSFKEEWKRKLTVASPRHSQARPREATALELLRVCREVQERFGEIEVQLLIIHGGDDVVCDPACAEELYKKAARESQEDVDVDLVFNCVIEWLRERAERAAAGGGDGESSVA
ncbi:hypothetical protein MKW98_026672 [Papaver atlanticum]|uniref:Serine aminopeptidase S33 domain-containing protein n=1 Tax=Papaver atlanticum TaxID=357466 RepID=A0AAD4RZN1_9MAGN|nr:hypothetical protein MKW98_026672 [Papaver atlanticum]